MRRKQMLVGAEFMADFLRLRMNASTVEGIPDDAQIVGASWTNYGKVVLIWESSTFEPVIEPEADLPFMEPLYHRKDPNMDSA